ncbi:MAG: metallophosphoesterase [Pseudomonadota bacterium]
MSRLTLFGLSIALHLYIGARIVPHLSTGPAAAFALLLTASALLMPLGMLARRIARPPAADRLAWAGFLAMGLFSSLFVLAVLRDVLLLGAGLLAPATGARLEAATAMGVPLLGIALTLLGLFNARRLPRVKTVEIPLPGLPEALHGFRLVQISDLHVGPTIRATYVQAVVDAVNALQADAVVLTGDLVDGSVEELAPHVAPLAALRSAHGSYAVTGNHEYYSGAGPWIAHLRRMGMRVLMNEHVVIERAGARLVLAGIPDHGAGHFDASHAPDAAAALRGAPADAAVRLLLAHQPRSLHGALAAGFDVQLSGHTHGGQFLPWNFFVRLQQPHTAGLHRIGKLWLYVSRGTGYWGPPKRLGAPSEITQVVLIRAAAA